MKYAILGPRGGINRIFETEPQSFGDRVVVELTSEQAALVEAGRESTPSVHYFWVDGAIMSLAEKQRAEAMASMTLDEFKSKKLRELESARWDAEVSGTEVAALGNAPVSTDKETQAELGKALAMLTVNPGFEIDWKFPHGEIIRLDGDAIKLIASVVFSHVQKTRTQFKELADAVLAADGKEAVNQIYWK